jgi:hypothetical protein
VFSELDLYARTRLCGKRAKRAGEAGAKATRGDKSARLSVCGAFLGGVGGKLLHYHILAYFVKFVKLYFLTCVTHTTFVEKSA